MPINNHPLHLHQACHYCENTHYLAPYARADGKNFCSRFCWVEWTKKAQQEATKQLPH